ncbi:MAG: DUF4350 domain-containing protein [Gemmatimonadota bacterium]|nr:DUF4350 domain-containing protein [Gemmatimonadota bacterium]
MGSRRDTVLAGIVIVLVIGLALLDPGSQRGGADPRPTTFRNGPHGTRALYLALEQLKIPVERRLSAYVDADSLAGPLVLLAPSESPTPAELRALARWIEGGGTLFYAARSGDATLDTLGLSLQDLASDSVRAWDRAYWGGVAAGPRSHPWTEGVRGVPGIRFAFADSSRALRTGSATPLLVAPGGQIVAAEIPLGRGRVIAWSDPAPLANAALREDSDAALLFARAAAEVGGTVRFDEYHHGYRGDGSVVAATLRFLRDTRPGHAVLQLAAAGLGLLLLLGRRFGSPMAPAPVRRRSPLEHVEALAGAYRQAGARRTARRLVIAGLARRLRRPPPAEGAEAEFLEQLAARLPAGQDTAQALRAEWVQGTQGELTELARLADRLITQTTHS